MRSVGSGVLWTTLSLVPWFAWAAAIENPIATNDFKAIVTRITDFALTILGPLSAIMVLIAGALYMTGGGNPEKIKRAHKVLIWALVGIAIVLLAKSAEILIRQVINVKP